MADIAEYLETLPPPRREIAAAVRKAVLDRLRQGYQELLDRGTIVCAVPLCRYPSRYNRRALQYAALANQRSYVTST